MKYGALFGWGFVIYAVMYLVGSGLLIYGLGATILSVAAKLGVLVAVASIAGRSLRLPNWKDVVPYSVGWAVIALLLDAVFWVPFAGILMYASLGVWAGYILLAAVPIIAVRMPRRTPQTV